MKNQLLDIREAAKILGVSIDTLRRWDKNGKLSAVRFGAKGHRHYRKQDLDLFSEDLLVFAKSWVLAKSADLSNSEIYCATRDTFQARLEKFKNKIANIPHLKKGAFYALIAAVVGEIGNNSFDHNLGNWRDVPGILFIFDEVKNRVILADRGQGILKTLRHVRPTLDTHLEALQVAFTEIISGRAPESRGNGLKYVKNIILKNPLRIRFWTGDAKLFLQKGVMSFEKTESNFQGCLAIIEFLI